MSIFSWQALLALLAGGLYGAVFGSIPGLTATLAVALFIPIAFFLDPVLALPAIIAISSVAIYAGDVGSVIARIPGTPASAAYVEELNELSKERGASYPLGISALGSAVGGVIGTLLLIFSATGLAAVAKNFASFEYFWIAVLGLTAGIFASSGPPLKALVSLLIGVFFATVGVDPTLGYPRFDFGNPNLLGGLNYIVAMIGLFGFSEVLGNLYRPGSQAHGRLSEGKGLPVRQFYSLPSLLMLRNKLLVLRSSLIGTFVGFLPGAGADIGAWVASSLEKLSGRKGPEARDRVVLSGTSSNNAAVASAWIPALALGLPGDTVTAIVLGVFLMKGITPGPLLFEQQAPLVWALFGTFLFANLFLLPVFGFLTARIANLIVRIPFNLLLGLIAGLSVVGSYAINNNPFDVAVMVAMGAFAFLLRLGGFPLAQVVLGMVLGPILEQSFMVSAIKSRWDLGAFFDRPIAMLLMAATILVIVVGVRVKAGTGRAGLLENEDGKEAAL
jgi:putative tricarboxylic transport membrane protein